MTQFTFYTLDVGPVPGDRQQLLPLNEPGAPPESDPIDWLLAGRGNLMLVTPGMGVKGVDGWHDTVEFQSALGYIATLPGGQDEFLGRPFPQVLFAHYAQWFFGGAPLS